MRIKAPLLAGGTGVSLLLLALAGPSGEQRGGVVLNPDPPAPPRWGLKWDGVELPKPAGQAAGAMASGGPLGIGEPPCKSVGYAGDAVPVEDPYAG